MSFKALRGEDQTAAESKACAQRLGFGEGAAAVQSPNVKAVKRAIELCTEIYQLMGVELARAWNSMVKSHVPGEMNWIEASLRLVNADRLKIKEYHESVQAERENQGDTTL